MIVVTGSCRTGTSLMMQILRGIGVSIVGQAFHDDFSHIDLNPWGYWELPIKETIYGVNSYEYKGKAVKLFGLQFARTDPKYVQFAVVCKRKECDAINSTVKLLERDGHRLGISPTREMASIVYHSNYALIDAHILKGISYIEAEFDDMVNNREMVESRILSYMEVLKWR